MRHVFFATMAVSTVVMAGAAVAQVPRVAPNTSVPSSSNAALDSLLEEWHRIGFVPPSKPAQFRVYGRDGYVTSGPGYGFMVALIRAAAADSHAGRDGDALTKIATVRGLLAPHPVGDSITAARTPQ